MLKVINLAPLLKTISKTIIEQPLNVSSTFFTCNNKVLLLKVKSPLKVYIKIDQKS